MRLIGIHRFRSLEVDFPVIQNAGNTVAWVFLDHFQPVVIFEDFIASIDIDGLWKEEPGDTFQMFTATT